MPKQAMSRAPFAQRLLRIRKAAGLSQYDLAKTTGISHRMIAHYETHIKYPSADTVMRLAKALKVSTEQLMGSKTIKIKEEVNRKTLKKVRMLDELGTEDRKTVIRMIDTLHKRPQRIT